MIKRTLSFYFTTSIKSKLRRLSLIVTINKSKINKIKDQRQFFFVYLIILGAFLFFSSFFLLTVIQDNDNKNLILTSNNNIFQLQSSGFDADWKNSFLIKSNFFHSNREKGSELVENKLNYQSSFEKENLNSIDLNQSQKEWLNFFLLLVSIISIFCIFSVFSIFKLLHSRHKIIMILNKRSLIKQLNNNQFIVYYQPIINPFNHKIMACEALLRFQDGDEILPPLQFLDQIEEMEMMEEVTLWLVKEVVKHYQLIRRAQIDFDEAFYISLNLSFKELESSSFVNRLKSIIAAVDLKSNKLCFEITEKYPLINQRNVCEVIRELRKLGIKIAIDDFGIKKANLDVLDKIEYDVIKLDKYFSDGLYHSSIRRHAMLFITDFVNHHHKKLIIEGIEEIYQLELIKEFNHDFIYVQGYIYSPPMSLDKIMCFKID